jgi:TPR repeat protein
MSVCLALLVAAPSVADPQTTPQGPRLSAAEAEELPIAEMRQAAEAGDPVAQFTLAGRYARGVDVPEDQVEASRWVRRAADQGLLEAQHNLGLHYEAGLGVPLDYTQAAAWFRKAADHGFPESQFALGAMYDSGRGVAQDELQAIAWYRKAAEQGNAQAQFTLGMKSALGRGVRQDDDEAIAWFRKAADQGVAAAEQNLRALSERNERETLSARVLAMRIAAAALAIFGTGLVLSRARRMMKRRAGNATSTRIGPRRDRAAGRRRR